MASAIAAVSWFGAGQTTPKCSETGAVAIRARLLFVNGMKKTTLRGCRIECAGTSDADGATVVIHFTDASRCCVLIRDAVAAALFLEELRAAVAGFAAATEINASATSATAAPRPRPPATPLTALRARQSTRPRRYGVQAFTSVPDFGGRLATFLWKVDAAGGADALDGASTLGASKRRRCAGQLSVHRLMCCSHSVHVAVIMGIKEHRAFLDGERALAFDYVVEAVKRAFPKEWLSLRQLQFSDSRAEDTKVCYEVLKRHIAAE